MDFSYINIINVIGSLALFIYGLKVMSDGIQRAAGKTLRSFLNRMTSNTGMALFTGFIITSLIQSSSASTVLTVGFVNAGLLNLSQSIGVIFGINIGTTITGWIISVLGIQLNSYQTVLPMLIISIPLLFSKKKHLNAWGDFLMGFFLLLIGLFFMRDNVPDFSLISARFSIVESLSSYGFLSTVMFLFFGLVATVILQSSTATMALTLVLCTKGWIPFDVSAAMILGANIGTTSTAEIAALIGNLSARRSARIHTFFNLYGALWALALMPLMLRGVDQIGLFLFYDQSAFLTVASIPIALAIYHSLFNILNVALFMLIPRVLIISALKTVKANQVTEEKYRFQPFSDKYNLPELTILGAQKEVAKFASVTKKMNQLVTRMLIQTDDVAKENCYQLIVKNEDVIDQFEKTLINYLTESQSVEVTSDISHKISALQNICHEFERIGDLYLDMANVLKEKNIKNIWFNTQQRTQLQSLLFTLNKQHKIIIDALQQGAAEILIKSEMEVLHLELKNITKGADKPTPDHAENHPMSIKVFDTFVITTDNISDHLYNVSRLITKNL